jgi:ElaB/YqjD/DUF883 family membrane-anchored ribosome-binding protein
MKQTGTLTAAVVFFALLAIGSPSFAQTMQQPEQMNAAAADHLMNDLSSLMGEMTGMMTRMTELTKEKSPEIMKELSGLMNGLSKEMMNLSTMLSSGNMPDRAMEKMHVRLSKMQARLAVLETKK